ncbi:glycosyl hydrolase family 28-related protein [Vibrio harveyi]|uniref:glycosyl hydrolase family 28-related protein n=1 Tax=Vibrio harveyi TaxID=669 RepID=UPI003CEA31CB
MHPLQNGSQATERPANKPPSGLPGWFTESGENNVPSYPGADWFNKCIAELLNAAAASGLTFDPNSEDNLARAIAYTGTASFDYISSVDGNVSLGQLISVEDYGPDHNSGRLYFKVVEAGTGTPDGGRFIDLPKSNLQLKQNLQVPYNVKAFGAMGNGINNDYPSIQAALNTRKSVFAPSGEYLCLSSIAPHRQQMFYGEGGVQRSALSGYSSTVLKFPLGVTGIDLKANIAIGAKVRMMAIVAEDQETGNGTLGIKVGEKGVNGGASQGIKVELTDLYVSGFDIDYGLYGWSWEVSLTRCFGDFARSIAFDSTDSTTIVSMIDCSALQPGSAYGTSPANINAKSYSFNGNCQVYMHSPRAENTLGNGFNIGGNAKVTVDSIYCEGNRITDVNIENDFEGQLVISNGRMIHDNAGTDTFACVRNTSNKKCFISIVGIEYEIGATTDNTTTSGFYYSESEIPHVIIEGLVVGPNVARMSSGNKQVVYLSQSGRFAPSEFTVSDLPNVRFYRRGTSHIAIVQGSLPTSLLISDGTNSYDMLTDGSVGEVGGRTYRWVSSKSAWALITSREYASLDRKNSADVNIERWWGNYKGIEVVRFNGGPTSTTVKIDTTGASNGADFYVRSYSSDVTPSTITVIDENDAVIATLTPSFSGAGGIVALFSYFDRVGVGSSFQLQHVLREN